MTKIVKKMVQSIDFYTTNLFLLGGCFAVTSRTQDFVSAARMHV